MQPAGQTAVQWSRSLFDALFPSNPTFQPSESLVSVYLELGKQLLNQEGDAEKAEAADHITPMFLRLFERATSAVLNQLLTILPMLVEANPTIFSSYFASYFLTALKDVQNPHQSDHLRVLSSLAKTSIAPEVSQCVQTQIQCVIEDYLKGSIPDLSILKHVFARLQQYAAHFSDSIGFLASELAGCEEKVTSQILAEIAKHVSDEFFEASAVQSLH